MLKLNLNRFNQFTFIFSHVVLNDKCFDQMCEEPEESKKRYKNSKIKLKVSDTQPRKK